MSDGYNSRLKPIRWKGEVGDAESLEATEKWKKKVSASDRRSNQLK